MTPEEYKQLEKLLGQLSQELGGGRVCIIHEYAQDGTYIGIYDDEGNVKKQGLCPNIETAVKRLKS